MAYSNKTIAISAAVAFGVIIVIVGIVFVFVPKSDKSVSDPNNKVQGVKSGIFTRCDKVNAPLEEIKISSCPKPETVGYCEMKTDATTNMEFIFTPGKCNDLKC